MFCKWSQGTNISAKRNKAFSLPLGCLENGLHWTANVLLKEETQYQSKSVLQNLSQIQSKSVCQQVCYTVGLHHQPNGQLGRVRVTHNLQLT